MQLDQDLILSIGDKKSIPKLKKLLVNNSLGYTVVEMDNIVRLKADNNYTIIFLADGKEIIVSKTLKDFEGILADKYFIRVHRSDIINLIYLKEFMSNGNLIMKDGTRLNISRRRHKEFLKVLKTFFVHL